MRLLIYEPSYRRVKAAVDAMVGLELFLMDREGAVTHEGRPCAAEEVRPEAGWANADVFFGPAGRAYASALLKSSDLKWVQSGAAGVDDRLFVQIVQKGARLTTSHGQAVGIADYVLWGVLDHYQRGAARRATQASAAWKRTPYVELDGTRWVVIGFGAIGEGVGRRARAFGAHVTGVRRNPAGYADADRIAALADLPGLLPMADVVALCCPLTAETRGLADGAFFGAMKPGSVLVNVGRGGLVDEAALLAAVDRDAPEHAVLDVFATEPLPPDSPLWRHPKVTATSHLSGMSSGNAPRNDALFVENLARFLKGDPLLHEAAPAEVLAG